MSRLSAIPAACIAVLCLGGCQQKQDVAGLSASTATETSLPASTVPADANIGKAQDFVNQAAQDGLLEIRTSEMALERTRNPDIKAFAQLMIEQHKATGDQLKAAATQASLASPAETLDDTHMRRINDLVAVASTDFDNAYMALQVTAHDDAVKLFTDYSKDPNALPAIKSFASNTLPTLTALQVKAQSIRDSAKKLGAQTNPT